MSSFEFTKEFLNIFIAVLVAGISIIVLYKARRVKIGRIDIDLMKDIESIENLDNSYDIETDTSIDKQFILLKQYHSQGLAQSRISFWFSLIFASIGFGIIVIAILSSNKDVAFFKQSTTLISLISGTIIDSVSVLFFVQSNKSRELMAEFFDKLRVDRKLDESLKLADQIPDELLRSKLKMILSLNFAQIATTDDIMSLVLRELEQNSNTTQQKI